jgi:flagellar assembly protein FliH
LSNVIKAYNIRYEEAAKKTIDTHIRFDKELEERKNKQQTVTAPPADGEFVEGLQAVLIDQLPTGEEIQEKASELIKDAKKEAGRILDDARKEAARIKKEAYVEGEKKGYGDGMHQSQKELNQLKAEYDEKARRLKRDYEEMATSLEPQMAEIIASLVEKLTGIVIEDKEEVILYLVDKTLKNMDKCNEYTIKVSKEDFEYLSMRKNLLLGAIGREVSIYIEEDANLKKNQCLIETELKVINCSLDVQLDNLIMDLKLIAGI